MLFNYYDHHYEYAGVHMVVKVRQQLCGVSPVV